MHAEDRWPDRVRTVVLVEGDSDAAALRALAARLGHDLVAEGVHVLSAHGVTNFARLLLEISTSQPDTRIVGLYDAAEEHHVRRGLNRLGLGEVTTRDDIAGRGFFVCVADLEEEMIRALGTDGVERVLAEQDELVSFRRFQAMPDQRGRSTEQHLHRFLGTRSMRKVRYGTLLVEALDPALAPDPLVRLLECALSGARNPPDG